MAQDKSRVPIGNIVAAMQVLSEPIKRNILKVLASPDYKFESEVSVLIELNGGGSYNPEQINCALDELAELGAVERCGNMYRISEEWMFAMADFFDGERKRIESRRLGEHFVREMGPVEDYETFKENMLSNLRKLGYAEARIEGEILVMGEKRAEAARK